MGSTLEPKEWLNFIIQKKQEYDRYLNLLYIKRGFAYTVALFATGYLFKLAGNIRDDFIYVYTTIILLIVFIVVKTIVSFISDFGNDDITLLNIPHSNNIELTRLEAVPKLLLVTVFLAANYFIFSYSGLLGFHFIKDVSLLLVIWSIFLLVVGLITIYSIGAKLLFIIMRSKRSNILNTTYLKSIYVLSPSVIFLIFGIHLFKLKSVFQVNVLLCYQFVVIVMIAVWAIHAIYLSYIRERNIPDFNLLEQLILRGSLLNTNDILEHYENIVHGPKPISWIDEKISLVNKELGVVRHEILSFLLIYKISEFNVNNKKKISKAIKKHGKKVYKTFDKMGKFVNDISIASKSGCFNDDELDQINLKVGKIEKRINRLKILSKQEDKIIKKIKGDIFNERPSATRP